MKNIILSATALFALLALAGCGAKDDAPAANSAPAATGSQTAATSNDEFGPIATAASYEVGSKKVGDKAVCVVCSVNDGKAGEEEDVKQTLDYQGKTFVFCNESEKADFISNPKRFTAK